MCVHLLANATVLDSAATFQKNVYSIHSLGRLLPVVEWGFIFFPLLFHAFVGIAIMRSGVSNTSEYTTSSNVRYTLQRASGMIAFFFIMWHVFHMHGWFHFDVWIENVASRFGGAKFAPYSASSTAGAAIQASILVQILYAVGILACVFHLANGLWTMGITWGVWVSPAAQRRADYFCVAFGLALAVVGLSGLWGMRQVDVDAAKVVEDKIYHSRVAAGELQPAPHKRAGAHNGDDESHEAEEHAQSIDNVPPWNAVLPDTPLNR
jgi:succinate dehydrogenase / fumarate reductase cytochrome b subunit